ncbi:bifunctional D-glycero-beta-D-manno-heptose-7-phosphate kinase/D-glycero-beta-D-manno-heptose 1-phosphate adenylyltransferase HldE [Comamonas sp. JC664]|uniref:bifunctional D-glycero-beta-D-manno-heptose-7-phosphate kinase/D-glycero-beta-D-manno-heptose 1-phosphate adenylyltransferase HldE n=1 Tax=Comamonas sp. JC664 TaxID=2801917 RepID=UPI0017497B72|nr:bifunctional D-glycero-beta-D-manno-heptose-7-phosphate kinase/D-glycero-beta-D-manno-heptose 1-phosphate adenylyltransferase HldE [Comamonas sp. JC664]MBL0695541.1 bifunctional D-glycero-beta-D-manno-heptose-7-phosphate kinase/D-glycero-beta-D-manno-heptose 1-phosphate adenylyltransferase HldE [Comamonas sp. JC664]GHG62135.1 bifunctional protein HldE [Comamonas sp. KCTC 72670]
MTGPARRIPPFHEAQVLVVGDVMLDRSWHGEATRISPEAPVPVVRVSRDETRAGGAANVAVNAAALGAEATLLGVTGDDADADALHAQLETTRVRPALVRLSGARTITKLRVLGTQQQLLRMDFEDGLPGSRDEALLELFQPRLAEARVVVLSDYGKGTLKTPGRFIELARAAGRLTLVAPKGTDFTRYQGASVLVPNRSEFEAVAGPCADDATLTHRGLAMLRALSLDALLITRGAEGMTLLREGHAPFHVPSSAEHVRDVTGAGDTVIAVLAAALAVDVPLPEAVTLASAAAGIVIGKRGTCALSVEELTRALTGPQEPARGVVTESRLAELVREAKARGERVALTLGCFDILHAGHVRYLEQLASLADRVIVAVNDDGSVQRLKGPARPLNPVEQRMQVLAGLASVDWVVPFSEDTPERLVCRLLPDLLVKGGDYRPEQVPGQRCVREAGGEVRILDFVDGCSTSGLVARIHERGGAKTAPTASLERG